MHVTNPTLIGVLSKLQPSVMQPLLRRLVFDVPHLTDHSKMPLKVNTHILQIATMMEYDNKPINIVCFIDFN